MRVNGASKRGGWGRLHAAEGGVAALAEVEVVAHVALEPAADDGVLRALSPLSLSLSSSISVSYPAAFLIPIFPLYPSFSRPRPSMWISNRLKIVLISFFFYLPVRQSIHPSKNIAGRESYECQDTDLRSNDA